MPTLTKEQRAEQALARKIAAERAKGRPWDGASGICEDPAFPTVRTAQRGRALLRSLDSTGKTKGTRIAPSYPRTDAFRAAESARRQASKEQPKAKAPRKRTAPKAKRTK